MPREGLRAFLPGWQHILTIILTLTGLSAIVALSELMLFPSGCPRCLESVELCPASMCQTVADTLEYLSVLVLPLAALALFAVFRRRPELIDGVRLGLTFGVMGALVYPVSGLIGRIPSSWVPAYALKSLLVGCVEYSLVWSGLLVFLNLKKRELPLIGGTVYFFASAFVAPFLSGWLIYNTIFDAGWWMHSGVENLLKALPFVLNGIAVYSLYDSFKWFVPGHSHAEKILAYSVCVTALFFLVSLVTATGALLTFGFLEPVGRYLTGPWESALVASFLMAGYEYYREHHGA